MVNLRTERRRFDWRSAAARRLLQMAGNPTTVTEGVHTVADRLLQGVGCPPTDLDALQSRLNIKAVEIEDIPFSGELRRDHDGFKIVIAKHISPSRVRFTVAHELAHAILETSGPRCPRFGSELERLCDMLATELLMPRSVFLGHLGVEVSMNRIQELSRTFKTSLSSTAIRVAELRGCTTFEVENSSVAWGYGIVRKGPLRNVQASLAGEIHQALQSASGTQTVYLLNQRWTRDWKLEWTATSGGARTLFVLQPMKHSISIAVRNSK